MTSRSWPAGDDRPARPRTYPCWRPNAIADTLADAAGIVLTSGSSSIRVCPHQPPGRLHRCQAIFAALTDTCTLGMLLGQTPPYRPGPGPTGRRCSRSQRSPCRRSPSSATAEGARALAHGHAVRRGLRLRQDRPVAAGPHSANRVRSDDADHRGSPGSAADAVPAFAQPYRSAAASHEDSLRGSRCRPGPPAWSAPGAGPSSRASALGGFAMPTAIGTSLPVVAMKSAADPAGYLHSVRRRNAHTSTYSASTRPHCTPMQADKRQCRQSPPLQTGDSADAVGHRGSRDSRSSINRGAAGSPVPARSLRPYPAFLVAPPTRGSCAR